MIAIAQAPLLLAISAIDERSRIVIEQAGGKVGRASTGENEGDELATLLVRLPANARIAALVKDDRAIAIDWCGAVYHLHWHRSLNIDEAAIAWGWLDVEEEAAQ